MFSHEKDEMNLPGWLWFFLILPVVLILALLYRQKRLPQMLQRFRPLAQSLPRPFNPVPRYTEPDSIPLEIRSEETLAAGIETVTGDEEIAISEAMAAEKASVEPAASSDAPDDIKIIEGIGPYIAGLLRNAGIGTFRQLADTSVERLDAILTNARLRHLADPATWPEQAALAAEGNWERLQQLQSMLKAGRRPKIT